MSTATRPLWQEPTLHLLWFLPCLCLAVLGWLLWQAGASAGTQELDGVRKIAQIQFQEKRTNLQATSGALQASLQVWNQLHSTQLTLTLEQPADIQLAQGTALALGFVHPSNSAFDHWVRLDPQRPGVWSQQLKGLHSELVRTAHWRLRLFPLDACDDHALRQTPKPACLDAAQWQLYGQATPAQLAAPLQLLPRYASTP